MKKRIILIPIIILVIVSLVGCSSSDTLETNGNSSGVKVEEEVSNEKQEVEEIKSEDIELLSYELVKNQAIATLNEHLGENGEILVYEENETVLFSVPSVDGVAECIVTINSGIANDELIESYEYMRESFIELSKNLYELGQTCGRDFALGLQNDKNPDKLLLTIFNGIVIDEAVKY